MCYVLCCQLSFRMPNFLRNFEDNENLAMVLHKVTLRVLYTALYASGHITVVHKWVWVLGKFKMSTVCVTLIEPFSLLLNGP